MNWLVDFVKGSKSKNNTKKGEGKGRAKRTEDKLL